MRISDWSSDVCSSDLQFHNNLIGTAVNADDGVQQAAELVQADVDRGIGYPSPTGLVIVVRIKRAGRNFAGEQFAIIGQLIQYFPGPDIAVRFAKRRLDRLVIGEWTAGTGVSLELLQDQSAPGFAKPAPPFWYPDSVD